MLLLDQAISYVILEGNNTFVIKFGALVDHNYTVKCSEIYSTKQ